MPRASRGLLAALAAATAVAFWVNGALYYRSLALPDDSPRRGRASLPRVDASFRLRQRSPASSTEGSNADALANSPERGAPRVGRAEGEQPAAGAVPPIGGGRAGRSIWMPCYNETEAERLGIHQKRPCHSKP
eukprot:jgi/Tetstr1/421417/TSEL_012366.t1